MSDTTLSVPALLKKTEHYDKDERYMATSDLCEVLKRQAAEDSTTTMDAAQERQICTAVLRLLHDKSNDVQAIAVKTLSVLLTTVQQEQALEIADSLADQVLDASKSELRDVYAIGLRTLVKTIPSGMGDRVSQRLAGRLLDGIRQNEEEEIVLACLDVLTDLLQRFGATATSVTRQHEPILQLCLQQLLHGKQPVVRKRAGNTLACLSTVLADALLHRMVESLLQSMVDFQGQSQFQVALIRTLCTVSGSVGHRLAQEQIDRMVPLFLQFTKPDDAVTGDDENIEEYDHSGAYDELRESCFVGFESFVLRCPKQVEPHLRTIIQAALAYMSYDPNYSYGDMEVEDEANEAMSGTSDNDYEDEYENGDEEQDDEEEDDDESWKVRRSAIRTLKAIIHAKKHDMDVLWTQSFPIRQGKSDVVAMAIMNRFKEREENCRVELLDCFTQLLLAKVQKHTMSSNDRGEDSVVSTCYTSKIIKACEKILDMKKGNDRSKSNALELLSALCHAPGGLGNADSIRSVFSKVQLFLATEDENTQPHHSSKTLRLDALTLVRAILNKHEPCLVRESLRNMLLPQLCAAVKEQWYKVIAEALRALSAVPSIFVGADGCAEVATHLYDAIEPLLATHDVDQEIKECALKACAALLCDLNASLSGQQKQRLLLLLLDRLSNETTRITAMKTISTIAASPESDMSPIVAPAVRLMSSFLKLQSRSLKQTSLEALEVIITNHGKSLGEQLLSSTLVDLAPLIVPSDLHLTHLSLHTCVSILKAAPAAGPSVKVNVLGHALNLSTSSLLQDQALESLLSFFKTLVVSNAVEFKELLELLQCRLTDDVSKTGIYILAECIASISSVAECGDTLSLLNELLKLLESNEATSRQVQLALLITGDLGRMLDLSTLDQGSSALRLKDTYMNYFESSIDELTHAAAYSLGNASVGAPGLFLHEIVRKIEDGNKKQQYLVLSALREFIKCGYKLSQAEKLSSTVPLILPPLEKHSGDEEEGVRTMVAECLGSLACLQPNEIFTKLELLLEGHWSISSPGGFVADGDDASRLNARVCSTVAAAVKLAIAGKVDQVALGKSMPTYVRLLRMEELTVRSAALLMVYSAAHHMPKVLLGLLDDSIIPQLFIVSRLKLERKVDLGPFTHTVDDALPLRKAALSIFATCIENLPGSIEIATFMPVLASALGDAEDIQLHAHQIVIAMCSRHSAYLVASVDSFVDPLEKSINKKAGQKTGTELERLNDWIKSSLRVLLALSKLDGAMNSRKFADFVERTRGHAKFGEKLRGMEEER